jgi:hypothetical protein
MMNRVTALVALAVFFVTLFVLAVTSGYPHDYPFPVKDDPCTILREETTDRDTLLQWCDLDDDGEAELIQEVIRCSHGNIYYLDFYIPDNGDPGQKQRLY